MKNIILNTAFGRLIYKRYVEFQQREKKVTYGDDNPDKFFYVIGQKDINGGLWWLVNKVVMHIAYACDKGYIPIVDLKHYETQYHSKGELNTVNVWEKFFQQPDNYGLEDISSSKNICLSSKKPAPSPQYLMGNTDFYTDFDRLNYFKNIFSKYIKFNENTHIHLEAIRCEVIGEQRVLGVLCRGTDYTAKKPKGHPIQPEPERVIEDAKQILRDYRCDKIFLATEDITILDIFKKEFGNTLCYIDQKRISKEELSQANLVSDVNRKVEDKYRLGIDYLSATYILSRCNCFLAGRTGGTKGVLLMSPGFEYMKVYDLGLY